jgi:CDP-6-deoxy-D-xylo-4-hexulose-3-dehydrase
MRTDQAIAKITPRTKAVFLTHALGYNALDQALLDALENRGVPLVEDVCESYGATFLGRRLGGFGLMSNFSFYYAHHLSTIEGGMVSTDDPDLHEMVRMLRAHGLVREASSEALRRSYAENHPDLNPEFIFAVPGFNVRSTEIQAVIGRSQLRRLDDNNRRRVENFALFLENLDPSRYRTDFATEGSCNYAFTLILRQPDAALFRAVTDGLRRHGIEFRRGTAGGGNQLRQPYVRDILGPIDLGGFPNVEHVHRYGAYIGNYPGLEKGRILELCAMLNDLPVR